MAKVSADAELRELGEMLRRGPGHSCECGFFATRTVSLDAEASNALGDPYAYVRVCDACDAEKALLMMLCAYSAAERAKNGLPPIEDVVRGHATSVDLGTARLARRHRALLAGAGE